MATVASATELTQWVADRLFENTWSSRFSVTRYYVPYIYLKDMSLPLVSVFSPAIVSTPSPRTKTTDDLDIGIRVYAKQVTIRDLASQDRYIKLLEEIKDYFRHQQTTLPEGCTFFNSTQTNLIDPDLLTELNLFAAQVVLQYKCRRDTGSQ